MGATDYPYIFFIAILIVFALMEWKYPSMSNKCFKCATIVTFVFVAFRAPVIAGDMWNYTKDAMGGVSFYTTRENMEPLYRLYKSLYTRFCPYVFPFMLINTLIIFTPIYYILKHYVKYKTIGVLLFFLMVNYFMFLAALRQCISLSLILWGMICIIENKKWRYPIFVALCVLAYFFHKSTAPFGILFLAIYFFPLKNKVLPCVAIGLSLLVGVILQKFNILQFFDLILAQGVLDEQYNGYIADRSVVDDRGEGLGMILRPLLAMAVFVLIDKEKVNHWFCKLYLAGVVMYNLLFSMYEIQRVVFPFLLFSIAAVPFILEGKIYRRTRLRSYLKIFFFLVLLYFTRSYVKQQSNWSRSDAGRLHPYYFIWQDYSKHPAITY